MPAETFQERVVYRSYDVEKCDICQNSIQEFEYLILNTKSYYCCTSCYHIISRRLDGEVAFMQCVLSKKK